MVRFDLGPLLQHQTRTAEHKGVYNLLIISPRGLQYEIHIANTLSNGQFAKPVGADISGP